MFDISNSTQDDFDEYVGSVVRQYRLNNGLSQTALGKKLGVTFQQIQKYESGKNSLSTFKLIEVAKVLGIPLQRILADDNENAEIVQRDTQKIVTAFRKIENQKVRSEIVGLIETLGARL